MKPKLVLPKKAWAVFRPDGRFGGAIPNDPGSIYDGTGFYVIPKKRKAKK